MDGYKDEQVINGTWGEVWIDSNYVAEVTGLEAKVTVEKAEVNRTRSLSKGYKIVGYEGKGTLKMNKVTSLFITMCSDNMLAGKQTSATIITKLNDPSSLGCERVKLNDCTFDELALANWEAKKNGEESVPFTFGTWEILDEIIA